MKFKILPTTIFTSVFIIMFYFSAFSQTNTFTSAVNWQNYSVREVKASFLMPRLPVVVNESDACRSEESFSYGSYTDGVAYVVRIARKADAPKFCLEKREFDKTNFEDRVLYLKTQFSMELRERESGKTNAIVLVGGGRITKLINDFNKNRWFEFTVYGADENKAEVKNFFAALKVDEKAKGIEIFGGAERTLGDEPLKKDEPEKEAAKKDAEKPVLPGEGSSRANLPVTVNPETSSKQVVAEPVRIILKPRANYTEKARNSQTQGNVLLRVTFLANGGIGAISIVSGLSDGLNEEAIAAAQRILFIPANKSGIRYSVIKQVQYTFTIY